MQQKANNILSAMRRRILLLLCISFSISVFAADGLQPGTTIYKPNVAWNAYTLVPDEGGLIRIIDMNGKVVHSWDIGTERARLLPDGNILVMQGKKAREYDWDGVLLWEYEVPIDSGEHKEYPTPGFIHHDMQRLPNGNTIFIYHEEVPEEYMELVKDPERKAETIIADCICEVNKKGEVVWEWHQYEQLDINDYRDTHQYRDHPARKSLVRRRAQRVQTWQCGHMYQASR